MAHLETPWTLWENLAKKATDDELKYIVADCRAAQVAMATFDTEREGYYSDQAATYQMEIRRRATA